jgi:tetratricopeptide (TPR) repeat protein
VAPTFTRSTSGAGTFSTSRPPSPNSARLSTPPRVGRPGRSGYLSNLGNALQTRFGRGGPRADIDQAITAGREAVDATPAGHPDRPRYLTSLGNALQTRFGRGGPRADIDQAITVGREAVDATPAGHPDRPTYLTNLGNALRTRFVLGGPPADVNHAITLLREAVDATPAGHPDRPVMLSNLGMMLQTRFECGGPRADLDQAIILLREGVDATPAGRANRPERWWSLGTALLARFEHGGPREDLDQAITLLREAVDATPADRPDRPRYLTNLGNALRTRFVRGGPGADLDQAITLFREAVDAIPVGHPDRPVMLTSLGYALRTRFERTGQRADLDQAITAGREDVDAIPVGRPYRPGHLTNLGIMLQSRFERTGQRADVDQAITLHREAINGVPVGHPYRPAMLSNLGSALQARFQRTAQRADLDQAITAGREAVDAAPVGHPYRPRYLTNLGNALQTRFEPGGPGADLDQAITLYREAVNGVPVGHPDLPMMLSNLGIALRTRFQRTRERADLDQAIGVCREGAGVVTASPRRRLAAALEWGQCALLAGASESATEGYTAAVELLPLVAWHGLDQATREHHLREWTGLACDAAAAAVAAGLPARAVELLEAGRSMLWTQALHLRQDLAALQARAPGLAAVLEASRAVLDTSSTSMVPGLDTAGDADRVQATEQQMLEQRRQAARDWDAAVDQIRRIGGFEHFLRPVPFTDLRAAATGGPVVIVNFSQHGSHALIVTPPAGPDPGPPVVVVDLPAAPIDTVIDQANSLLAGQRRAADPATDWQTKEADRHAVFNTLAWCWQAITGPVLTTLGYTRTPSGKIEDWPRVWWCPTGPATILPLHAAGRHPRTAIQYTAVGEETALADSVAGRVISSYTPTLTALTRARAQPAPGRVRQLAAAVPEAPSYAPGASPLPAIPAELQVLASYLPQPGHATHRLGPAATRQAVLDALPGHSWLHLSCHGTQHPADASLSAFLLHDQPLTLADLAALNLRETDLAYLSACHTATGDLRLLDEALHLAAALQLAGYRHVLATLWSISDMADTAYAHLLHPDPDHPSPADKPEADRAPYALHYAITHLRHAYPGEPLLWAACIHLGP